MTLKDTITRELWDSVGDPDGLAAVYERYGRSKGPFYSALGEATKHLRQRFETTCQDVSEAESKRAQLQDQVAALETQRRELEEAVHNLAREIDRKETHLSEAQGTLDKAIELQKRGFGEEELKRLFELLGEGAAAQGLPPEEGVAQFFQTAEGYTNIVSLELETKRAKAKSEQAKAEAERWEAEAGSREAHSRARTATIDLLETLMDAGVKESDLRRWTELLDSVGSDVEALSKGVKRFSSAEHFCKQREQKAKELQAKNRKSEAGLKALQEEQAQVKAAIVAVRDGALREMERTGFLARQHVNALLAKAREYGELQQAAETLRDELDLARALMSQDPEHWAQMPRVVIQGMILGMTMWSNGPGRNPLVAPPEAVRSRGGSLTPWQRVHLVDLLLWVLSGLMTEDDRKAKLSSRR